MCRPHSARSARAADARFDDSRATITRSTRSIARARTRRRSDAPWSLGVPALYRSYRVSGTQSSSPPLPDPARRPKERALLLGAVLERAERGRGFDELFDQIVEPLLLRNARTE